MKTLSLTLPVLLCLLSLSVQGQQASLQACKAYLHKDTLYIENDQIRQAYLWNGGNLALLSIVNRQNPQQALLAKAQVQADLFLPGEENQAQGGKLETEIKSRFEGEPQYLQASITFKRGTLEVKRVFEVHPGLAGIATHFYFRGIPKSSSWGAAVAENQHLAMIETNNRQGEGASALAGMAALPLPGVHWKIKAVQFVEATDHHNTLVRTSEFLVYRKPLTAKGNLLLAQNKVQQMGFWLLKEAPLAESQHAYPGIDFSADESFLKVWGLGVTPADVKEKEWVRAYGYVLGIGAADEAQLLLGLRQYQKNIRRLLPARDEMILMNTWGDRSQDSRMNEAFILKEIEAGKRLGVTHLQLDDGWQQGLPRNSASKLGQRWDDWSWEDWQPHKDRFPNGFSNIVKKAKEAGIELCLWFNPSKKDDYKQWEQDADILISYYRQWGIKVFKIDGIELESKQGEENLRRMFDKVVAASKGKAVFNLDVTAGRRMGYHYFNEYGNIFLENRYTDWANYYPHRTLRNLWMLSAYVPAEKLQIEWLNKWRNPDKYAAHDPLAPANVPFDYQMAITFMAQPLAWMESSNLPEQAFVHAGLLRQYRKVQHHVHQGAIFPIGSEPDGFSWTGLQSIHNQEGYLMIYREGHPEEAQMLRTWLPEGLKVRLEPVLGQGQVSEQQVKAGGSLSFRLPEKFSFCLYRYRVI